MSRSVFLKHGGINDTSGKRQRSPCSQVDKYLGIPTERAAQEPGHHHARTSQYGSRSTGTCNRTHTIARTSFLVHSAHRTPCLLQESIIARVLLHCACHRLPASLAGRTLSRARVFDPHRQEHGAAGPLPPLRYSTNPR